MAWTVPMTAVENAIWTSSQFNTYVRDNLLASETALATTAGQYMVGTSANTLAPRQPAAASVNTFQTTTSTAFTDLTTVGPSVTVTTGTKALVCVSANMANSLANTYSRARALLVGGTESVSIENNGVGASDVGRWCAWGVADGLTPGSNTFKVQYQVQAGTGTFGSRHIIVVPL